MTKWIRPALASVLLLALPACDRRPGAESSTDPVERDLAAILEIDTLTALVTSNSTSYFLYRGEPMGYEYEMLSAFAEANDLELRVRVLPGRTELLELLNRGEGDIAAARLTPTYEDSAAMLLTRPLYMTRPMVVQRGAPPRSVDLPEAADTVLHREEASAQRPIQLRARLVSDPAQLAGRTVALPEGSAYVERLVELSDSLGEDVNVVEVEPSASAEALIRRVARGELELTVAPENVARLRQDYFTNIVVRPAVDSMRPVVWAVRRNAPELRAAVDAWLASEEASRLSEELYKKYFVDRRGYKERVESRYLSSETGQLSEYDPLFQQHASAIGWDWRLLASQAYQESRFDPNAKSWAGATGLLQLMPGTAKDLGVSNSRDPQQNVGGAVKFIRDLQERWAERIPDEEERLRFVLASYNVGPGHVDDARRLTEKNGGDPNRWSDVAYWLLQKSKKEVYTDPVVEHGYARGLEPVTYVSIILDRFDHYRQFVRAPGEAAAGAQ